MNMNTVEYLAKIENVLGIPSDKRLTKWYGDYGIYEPKLNVTQKDIDNRIAELSTQLKKTRTIMVEIKETSSKLIPVENAQSIQEAVATVIEQYNQEEIVLDAEDFVGVEFIPEVEFDMEM